MTIKKFRGIIGICPVIFTTKDIKKLYKDNPPSYITLGKFAPKYIIWKDEVTLTSYVLQFSGQFDDEPNEQYLTFDVTMQDDLTAEEMSATGIEDFLNESGAVEFIKALNPILFDDYHRQLGNSKYLLVEYTYDTDRFGDCDVDIQILKEIDLYKES